MNILAFLYTIIQKIEEYFEAKSPFERWFFIVFIGFSVGTLLWLFVVPMLETATYNYKRFAEEQVENHQKELFVLSSEQQLRTKELALQILKDKINESYQQLTESKIVWQDILGEVSKYILEAESLPNEVEAHIENGVLRLKGNAEWFALLSFLNSLERSIPFLQIQRIKYKYNIEQENNIGDYTIYIPNSKQISENVQNDAKTITLFLDTANKITIPIISKLEIPQPKIIDNNIIPTNPIIIVQALMTDWIKINGNWIKKGDENNGIKFIEITQCGAIIEYQQQQNCIPIEINKILE